MSNGVWILTSENNDHDQHGAYFRACFKDKPTLRDLAEFFAMNDGYTGNVMDAVAFLEHLLAGGGRRGTEYEWFNLEFVEFGKGYN